MKPAFKRIAWALALVSPAVAAASTTQQIWADMCARCHGDNGNGKTKGGTKAHIKDYTSPKVQAAFTDTGLLKDLILGVSADDGTERMPAYKDKLTIAEAKDQIALIRSFKK